MTKAVVISTASPILFDYWMANFKTWAHVVDKIYVGNNSGKVYEYPVPVVEVVGGTYPDNIEKLLHQVTEDVVLIMHDDVFVFDIDFVKMCFEVAEKKIVSPIHNCHEGSNEIENAMVAKFGHHNSFFPYFVFVPMEAVRKTSINLHGYDVPKCPILGVHANGDQGFIFGLELQNAGYKWFTITRHLSHEFPVNPPWVHVQALSYNFLAGMVNPLDEYKAAWLIELCKLNTDRIIELSDKMFGAKNK